jgi:hypothetical protein
MALKVDYYASLSRAVSALDRDSYAARGAIYDREHKAMLRRLFSSAPPPSDDDIEREQQAFRAAIRRIEFGDDVDAVPLVPQRETSPEQAAPTTVVPPSVPASPVAPGRTLSSMADWVPEPLTLPERTPSREPQPKPAAEATALAPPVTPAAAHWSPLRAGPEPAASAAPLAQSAPAKELAWQEIEAALELARKQQAATHPSLPADAQAETDTAAIVERLKRKPIAGRVARRGMLAAVLLALGFVVYDFAGGNVEMPMVSQLAKTGGKDAAPAAPPTTPAAQPASQAVIFDSNPPNPQGSKGVGTVVWSTRTEPATAPRAGTTALQFNLTIPDRRIILAMSMRPEASGSAMSHLIELKFLRPDGEADPDIDNIASVVMTTVEQKEPRVLIGGVQKVAPGVFLFGLSGEARDREQNLRYLKEETWFDIPLTYRNGASSVLGVEKGTAGAQAVEQAIGDWERVAVAPADR